MKRGILEINAVELLELTNHFDVRRHLGTTVANKVVAAMESAKEEGIRLELSEEELEILMDSVAIPTPEDSPDTQSLRKKMTDLMMKFRSAI